MRTVVTAAQMKQLDTDTIVNHKIDSLVLMERAALSVVKHLKNFDLTHTLVVCGSGNNGGDGIAIARLLHLMGEQVSIYFAGNPDHRSEGCLRQMEAAQTYPIRWINNPDYSEYTTIVDALFGVGLSREITGRYAEIISQINQSQRPVVAVDIPSGVCADDGKIMGCAICADTTVTFAFAKAGQLIRPGKSCCGHLIVEDIGIYKEPHTEESYTDVENISIYKKPHTDENINWVYRYYAIEQSDMQLIPLRDEDGNKGTFGKVLLIAGTVQMPGASILCGRTIMRMGAGMLKMVVPVENREIIASSIPEAMLAVYDTKEAAVQAISDGLSWADVVVIGPGIGTGETAEAMVNHVLEYGTLPVVLDADGLNVASRHMDWLKAHRSPCIVTPHVGEMARLLQTDTKDVSADLTGSLQTLVETCQVQCVLKDSTTCIGLPDGTVFLNTTGNCGMATAGSGDVLTGIIGGLLAVGTDWRYAGALGAWLHGTVGDRYCKTYGTAHLMAGDLIDGLADLRIGERKGNDG